MLDKDYEKLIKEIKKKRLNTKINKILALVESRKIIESKRVKLIKEFFIYGEVIIDPKWLLQNIP